MRNIICSGLLVTAVCFGTTGCDTTEEKARKAVVESHAESLENKASAVRAQTKSDAANLKAVGNIQADADKEAAELRAKADKKAVDEAAKNLKKSGDQAAESLENKAKETREQK